MGFAVGQLPVWSVPPDWSKPVRESIGFSTEILQASVTGVTQHLDQRDTPRRTLTFDVVSNDQNRRVMDMLLAGYGGKWRCPIWPDVQLLSAPLARPAEPLMSPMRVPGIL